MGRKIAFLLAALNIIFKGSILDGGELLGHYNMKSCIYWEVQDDEINIYNKIKGEWTRSYVIH